MSSPLEAAAEWLRPTIEFQCHDPDAESLCQDFGKKSWADEVIGGIVRAFLVAVVECSCQVHTMDPCPEVHVVLPGLTEYADPDKCEWKCRTLVGDGDECWEHAIVDTGSDPTWCYFTLREHDEDVLCGWQIRPQELTDALEEK